MKRNILCMTLFLSLIGVPFISDDFSFANGNIYIQSEYETIESIDTIHLTDDILTIENKINFIDIDNKKIDKSYTEEELDILSRIISGEAQPYSNELQLAVGSVFLNRVNSSKYPNTFKEVAFQKGQYACTWDGNYDRQPTDRNISNAKYLLENGSVLPSDVIYQAQFKQGKGVHKTISYGRNGRYKMYFCY